MPAWSARVLTLFPEMFPGPLSLSLAGKALADGIWALESVDIRGFARDKHRSVDGPPCGGGPGMVMRPDVLAAALDATLAGVDPRQRRLYMSPRGKPLDQALVRALIEDGGVTIVCGRFEGVDERVLEARQLEEVSLGDFVLSGGEIAALALLDAVVRLLPGVMGKVQSATEESFATGLLEYPQYTRPVEWEGRRVPEVLLGGHHEQVRLWRQAEAERITRERRMDLWDRHVAAPQAKR